MRHNHSVLVTSVQSTCVLSPASYAGDIVNYSLRNSFLSIKYTVIILLILIIC